METSLSKPLHLIDVRTLRLQEFNADETPPYAMMSHTWQNGEEVTHGEFKQHLNGDKVGYNKIRATCKQAERDGLDYVWIDTCCIDKSSLSELSESINSMFAWYQNAVVCYALLSDVVGWKSDADSFKSDLFKERWEARWFSRGWCLQELLAPPSVKFFAEDWSPLGSLHDPDLVGVIAEASRVPKEVLKHQKELASCSVAQRLSWAAGRTTTKPEDLAYCLLGILGVGMNLRYGEGKRAFIRLQEKVLKRTGDLSVLAWMNTNRAEAIQLFAPSPASFRYCRDIVLDPLLDGTSGLHMTSDGLKGSFSVSASAGGSEDAPNQMLVLLACRHEASPGSPLALRVAPRRAVAAELSKRRDRTFAVCVREAHSKVAGIEGRLGTIDSSGIPHTEWLEVTIQRQGTLEKRRMNISQEEDIVNSKSKIRVLDQQPLRRERDQGSEGQGEHDEASTGFSERSTSTVVRRRVNNSDMASMTILPELEPARRSIRKPEYWVMIAQMNPAADARPRVSPRGRWLPPKDIGRNLKSSTAAAFHHDGNTARAITAWPGYLRLYKDFSIYHDHGNIWVVPSNATTHRVGDGRETSADKVDDSEENSGSEKECEDEGDNPDWTTLSFHHLTDGRSYAGVYGPLAQLPGSRPDQPWVSQILPDQYHPSKSTNDPRFGGLSGDLPLLIGLVALALQPQALVAGLPQCLRDPWRVYPPEQVPRGAGWLPRRGLVVSVYYDPATTDRRELDDYERGAYGPILP